MDDITCGDDLRPLLAKLPHRYPNEVQTTVMSGIEYSLDTDGHFEWAWMSVDGTDLSEEEFIDRLKILLRHNED